MSEKNFNLSLLLKKNENFSFRKKASLVYTLSLPAILAQLSTILMQYIDAAMVGKLGKDASAAIGLVASSIWLFGSLIAAFCVGFTVQVAHAVGAGAPQKAKRILSQSITCALFFLLLLMLIGISIAPFLPVWLGADKEIQGDASFYFLIFALTQPFYLFTRLMSAMLQCSGNMRLPGIMNALMCILDVVFNAFFIYVCKLGVKGAALGSLSAAFVTAILITYMTVFRDGFLCLKKEKISFAPQKEVIAKAIKLSVPVAIEQAAFTSALVAVTKIIAPMGSLALAANSFAVTAEALCYMPGYGIGEAATTLSGQSVGAKRGDLAKSFSWICTVVGMLVMFIMGLIMYFICPLVFYLLTPDTDVQKLAVSILRIEVFAEPMYAASIVAAGALRGAGDTFIPSLLNLFSLWFVRIGLSLLLAPIMGLQGIWLAMAIELGFRGLVFLCRQAFLFRPKSYLLQMSLPK